MAVTALAPGGRLRGEEASFSQRKARGATRLRNRGPDATAMWARADSVGATAALRRRGEWGPRRLEWCGGGIPHLWILGKQYVDWKKCQEVGNHTGATNVDSG
uniref:Uncharacterized protein n=1 Tax=Oryza meridionalis TaxID=40149 RepID=A0A0E0D0L1_9ORYZ